MRQFISSGLDKAAVPSTVHCDHLIAANQVSLQNPCPPLPPNSAPLLVQDKTTKQFKGGKADLADAVESNKEV